MKESNNSAYIIGITMVATLGGLLFGYDTAVISGTVGSLEEFFVTPRGLDETAANSLVGMTVSSALIGCIVGGFIAGWVGEQLGRKKALIISAVLFLISAIGSSFPEMGFGGAGSLGHEVLTQFIVYRIIGGIGVGIASMSSPLYISEIAPANIRGRLVSFNQLAIIFGIVVVYFVNYAIANGRTPEWLSTMGWRYMFGSEIIPATLFLVFLMFVPETPRWLVMKGRDEEASAVLNRLVSKERTNQVVSDIKISLGNVQKSELFTYGIGVLVIGVLISAFQQLIGINAVLYYAPVIFEEMGSSRDEALMNTITIVGVVNLLFTVVAILTVDKLGRKPLMIVGALLMAVTMIVLGMTFFAETMGLGSIICMVGYVAGFALSWGPVTWVLLSEMFPNKIRTWAMSIAVAVQWITNFVVSWTFPMMDKNSTLVETFHHGFAYWIYGLMALIAAWFVWKFVPETKGKTLEQMEALWSDGENNDSPTAEVNSPEPQVLETV